VIGVIASKLPLAFHAAKRGDWFLAWQQIPTTTYAAAFPGPAALPDFVAEPDIDARAQYLGIIYMTTLRFLSRLFSGVVLAASLLSTSALAGTSKPRL
jgi:hypothetical protein